LAKPSKPAPKKAVAGDPTESILARAKEALDADDCAKAAAIANEILQSKPSNSVREEALSILVWAELMRGELNAAERALTELKRLKEPDPSLSGNVALAAGRLSEARTLLEQAYRAGDRRKEIFGPLIQVLLRQDAADRASEIALDRFDSLSSDDARQVADIAIEGGALVSGAKLYERVALRERSRADTLSAVRAYSKAGDRSKAVEALKNAFIMGIVSESEVRSDTELGSLLVDPTAPSGQRG
jgi:hypothetical protein